MLVPAEEIDAFHTPQAIADHVTRFTLAAVGVAGPLVPPLSDTFSGNIS
jgi:hypothetical protein